jgi:hypothetical protein
MRRLRVIDEAYPVGVYVREQIHPEYVLFATDMVEFRLNIVSVLPLVLVTLVSRGETSPSFKVTRL